MVKDRFNGYVNADQEVPTGFRSRSSRARSQLVDIYISIIDRNPLPNPIIFLPIGDKPGPLGNTRRAVSQCRRCVRISIYLVAAWGLRSKTATVR